MRTVSKVKIINSFTALMLKFSWDTDIKLAYELFQSYPLVIVRNTKQVSVKQLKKLSKSFGDLYSFSKHPLSGTTKNLRKYHLDKECEIIRVSNTTQKNGMSNGTLGSGFINWHSDFSHMDTTFYGSMLYNKKNGDKAITSFCHTPDILFYISRKEYAKLKKAFGYHSLYSRVYKMKDSVHQNLVKFRKHKTRNMEDEVCKPIILNTIRKKEAVYLSPATLIRIDNGLKLSKYIRLIEKVNHYHHFWKPHDILIYDNISLLHKRSAFFGERILYRINFNYKKILENIDMASPSNISNSNN